jgi:hypothetical protein
MKKPLSKKLVLSREVLRQIAGGTLTKPVATHSCNVALCDTDCYASCSCVPLTNAC